MASLLSTSLSTVGFFPDLNEQEQNNLKIDNLQVCSSKCEIDLLKTDAKQLQGLCNLNIFTYVCLSYLAGFLKSVFILPEHR